MRRSYVRSQNIGDLICGTAVSLDAPKPYGFRVHYEAFINGRVSEKWFRAKCPQANAQRKAIFKPGFLRVVRLEPFTREEWLRVFGEGKS